MLKKPHSKRYPVAAAVALGLILYLNAQADSFYKYFEYRYFYLERQMPGIVKMGASNFLLVPLAMVVFFIAILPMLKAKRLNLVALLIAVPVTLFIMLNSLQSCVRTLNIYINLRNYNENHFEIQHVSGIQFDIVKKGTISIIVMVTSSCHSEDEAAMQQKAIALRQPVQYNAGFKQGGSSNPYNIMEIYDSDTMPVMLIFVHGDELARLNPGQIKAEIEALVGNNIIRGIYFPPWAA